MIIQTNNQYLKLLMTIPINGIPSLTLQTEIIIDDDIPEAEQVPIKVQDYLLSANWCHGLKTTKQKGRYSDYYLSTDCRSTQVAR